MADSVSRAQGLKTPGQGGEKPLIIDHLALQIRVFDDAIRVEEQGIFLGNVRFQVYIRFPLPGAKHDIGNLQFFHAPFFQEAGKTVTCIGCQKYAGAAVEQAEKTSHHALSPGDLHEALIQNLETCLSGCLRREFHVYSLL